MSDPLNDRLPELTAQIVAAYVGKNPVAPGALAELIGTVSQSLAAIGAEPVAEAPQLVPAVNPKKSVFPDYIVCLEDGKHFKSLKRHLNVHYGLSPAEYRQKWDLPADYPMVAPAYAAARSALAKSMGLGRKAEPAKKTPAKRGRKPA